MKKKENHGKTWKIIVSCFITIGITIVSLEYMGNLLDPKWTSGAMNAIKAFHTMDADTLEVIIYGSSHAWKGCDPMVMYEDYGLAAYNYGCNWQALNTTLLFLEDSLRTQTPKVVCIETYRTDILKQNVNMDGEIYYTRVISNFPGKQDYLKQCFGDNVERYVSYYTPIVMFHDNWNIIEYENFVDYRTVEDYVNLMGYEPGKATVTANLGDCLQFSQKEIPEDSILVLNKIMEVCEKIGAEVLFYTAPYEGEYVYSDAMKEYALEHGCSYINLFEHIGDMEMSGETDFRDKTHLNNLGAAKVADYLGEYIVNHYNVTDMRTVENNIWEQNAAR